MIVFEFLDNVELSSVLLRSAEKWDRDSKEATILLDNAERAIDSAAYTLNNMTYGWVSIQTARDMIRSNPERVKEIFGRFAMLDCSQLRKRAESFYTVYPEMWEGENRW